MRDSVVVLRQLLTCHLMHLLILGWGWGTIVVEEDYLSIAMCTLLLDFYAT